MLKIEIPYHDDGTHYYEGIRHLKWPVFLDSAFQSGREHSALARFDLSPPTLLLQSYLTMVLSLSKAKMLDQAIIRVIPLSYCSSLWKNINVAMLIFRL